MKKGSIKMSTWFLIEVFITCMVLTPIFVWISNFSQDSTYEKEYIAKDCGLLVDTILGSPNDVLYFYQENEFPFQLDITDGQVIVTEDDDTESFSIIQDQSITVKDTTIKPVIVSSKDDPEMLVPLGFRKKGNTLQPFSAIRTADILE